DRRYTQIFRLRVPATEIRGRENAPGSVGRPDRAGPDDRWARHGRSDGHPACRSTSPLTGQRDPHLGAGRDVVPETLGDVLRIDVAADQRGGADVQLPPGAVHARPDDLVDRVALAVVRDVDVRAGEALELRGQVVGECDRE